jgi:DNA-binding NtrC family response regulator
VDIGGKMVKILIADDQPYIRALLKKEMAKEDYRIVSLGAVELIWERIKDSRPDLVLLGLHPEKYDSWEILNDIKRKVPNLPVLIYVIKSFDDINSLKEAIIDIIDRKSFSPGKRSLSSFSFEQDSKPVVSG